MVEVTAIFTVARPPCVGISPVFSPLLLANASEREISWSATGASERERGSPLTASAVIGAWRLLRRRNAGRRAQGHAESPRHISLVLPASCKIRRVRVRERYQDTSQGT